MFLRDPQTRFEEVGHLLLYLILDGIKKKKKKHVNQKNHLMGP